MQLTPLAPPASPPPVSGHKSASSGRSFSRRASLWLLLLVVALVGSLLTLPFLGVSSVFEVSEGREGVVVNAMRESGELVLPLRHAEIVPSKPPLFHWAGLTIAKWTGRYTEVELRLPSALSALAMLLVTTSFTAYLAGLFAAALSAGILISTSGFYGLAIDGRVDMVFTLFVVVALCHFGSALIKACEVGTMIVERRTIITTSMLCGVAALAKGPLGFALVGLVALASSISLGTWRTARSVLSPWWLSGLIICLPWYVLAAISGQEGFVSRQVIFENFRRFSGASGITPKPPWFYLSELWVHGAPWSVVFAICAIAWLRASMKRGVTSSRNGKTLVYTLVWYLTIVLFLSLSVGKRRAYLLPTLPAAAIFVAVYTAAMRERFDRWWWDARRDKLRRNILRGLIGLAALTCGVGFLPLLPGSLFGDAASSELARMVAALEAVTAREWKLLLVATVLLVGCGVLMAAAAQRKNSTDLFFISIFLLVVYFIVVPLTAMVAAKGETHSYRDLARSVSQIVPVEQPLTFIKTRTEESFDGFFFYMGRTIRLHPPDVPPVAPGTYLARRKWLNAQSPQLLSRVTERIEGGRVVDKPEQKAVLFDLAPATENGAPPSERSVPDPSQPRSPAVAGGAEVGEEEGEEQPVTKPEEPPGAPGTAATTAPSPLASETPTGAPATAASAVPSAAATSAVSPQPAP